ncbi:cytochrome p450, partial [Trifolium pratense]
LNEDNMAMFACIMWYIWKQRNDVICRNERVLRTVFCECANSLITGWRNAREVCERHDNQQHSPQRYEWTRPAADSWKCKVDASFSRSRNNVGISVCIRDDQGLFVLAKRSGTLLFLM